MKNSDGLTNKQFLFCEELLKNGGCVHDAYKKAFPNDTGNNGHRCLKRPEVINYINKRQQQKQATMDKLLDAANKRLLSNIENGDDKESNNAIKIIVDLTSRLKELEKPTSVQTNPIVINVGTLEKPTDA
jgi:phage terminase small subunit